MNHMEIYFLSLAVILYLTYSKISEIRKQDKLRRRQHNISSRSALLWESPRKQHSSAESIQIAADASPIGKLLSNLKY